MSEEPPEDWIRFSVWTHQCDPEKWPGALECKDVPITGGVSWAAAHFMATSTDSWTIPRQLFEIRQDGKVVWTNEFTPLCLRRDPPGPQ